MGQILELIRLFGLFRLAKMKRRHDKALPFIRGYCTTVSLWALFNTGVMDELRRAPPDGIGTRELAGKLRLDGRILDILLDYLDCVRVVRRDADGRYALDALGRDLVEEPRGAFDLACGYEEVLSDLTALVKGEKTFGRDVRRRMHFIAKGSGELGLQLPFPVMADMVKRGGFRAVLDLGSGDLEFLFTLCRAKDDLRGYGIDISQEAVQHARERLAGSPFRDRIVVERGDLFELDGFLARWKDVDLMTACDAFHEHLFEGTEKIDRLLAHCRGKFPGVALLVAEFCRQPHERLRRRATAFVEHHLWHSLTNQVILSADEWRDIFRRAGYRIAEERVFDIVGHGYFLLR
jgi:ubiquinone/menaquinone biosynthesis C-methylase UbiE